MWVGRSCRRLEVIRSLRKILLYRKYYRKRLQEKAFLFQYYRTWNSGVLFRSTLLLWLGCKTHVILCSWNFNFFFTSLSKIKHLKLFSFKARPIGTWYDSYNKYWKFYNNSYLTPIFFHSTTCTFRHVSSRIYCRFNCKIFYYKRSFWLTANATRYVRGKLWKI